MTFQGKEITLENLSPVFTPEQEAAKRRELEQQMNNVLPWLHSKLVPAGTGHATVSWIVPE